MTNKFLVEFDEQSYVSATQTLFDGVRFIRAYNDTFNVARVSERTLDTTGIQRSYLDSS